MPSQRRRTMMVSVRRRWSSSAARRPGRPRLARLAAFGAGAPRTGEPRFRVGDGRKPPRRQVTACLWRIASPRSQSTRDGHRDAPARTRYLADGRATPTRAPPKSRRCGSASTSACTSSTPPRCTAMVARSRWWPRRSPVGATTSSWSARSIRRTPPAAARTVACERSLRRLGTDRLDLYLLHWRGSTPLAEVVEAFEGLGRRGQDPALGRQQLRRRRHGRARATAGGAARRGQSDPLQPRAARGRLGAAAVVPPASHLRSWPTRRSARAAARSTTLRAIAERHGVSPATIALAWVLDQQGVVTIPKASRPEHVRENHAALELTLTSADREELRAPSPRQRDPPRSRRCRRPARSLPEEAAPQPAKCAAAGGAGEEFSSRNGRCRGRGGSPRKATSASTRVPANTYENARERRCELRSRRGDAPRPPPAGP